MTQSSNATRFAPMFIGAVVTPGQKVFASSRPELIANSTKDKFNINPKAAEMFGIKQGDTITFIDMAKIANAQNATIGENERFYMAVNAKDAKTGELTGATIGKNKVFSYSGVWSAMHINKQDTLSARPEDMIRMELAISRGEDKAGCIATQKVAYEIVPHLNEDGENKHVIEEDGEEVALYLLTNRTVTAHDPKIAEEEDLKDEEGQAE